MMSINDPMMKHVMQGHLYVAEHPGEVLTSILGSCVAACLRDPETKLGGMNHFLLPGHDPRDSGSVRYGARSMEELVNALLRKGADRRRLEIWLFGGANVLGTSTGIGSANSQFAMTFARDEGFTIRGSDLGGSQGRRVRFNPHSGDVHVDVMAESPQEKPVLRPTGTSEIELF